MNYEIILNEQILKDFINFLPNTKVGEGFYVSLISRTKYLSEKTIKDSEPRKFLSSKKDLFYKIKQLECPLDSYRYRDLPIPQESLALYINPNPRNYLKAAKKLQHSLIDLTGINSNFELSRYVIKYVSTSKGIVSFVDFDFDRISLSRLLELLEGRINFDAFKILETRGGFHVLVNVNNVSAVYKKSWFRAISSLVEVDSVGDQLIPIPGTSQGMFMPKFLNLNNLNDDN